MGHRDTPAAWAAYIAEWKRRNPLRHHEIEVRSSAKESVRESHRQAKRAWKARNPDKVREAARIHTKLLYHVRRGNLVKTPCVVCGNPKVQAHHHNGYDPEHELDVVWLCSLHHTDAHGRTGLWRRAQQSA